MVRVKTCQFVQFVGNLFSPCLVRGWIYVSNICGSAESGYFQVIRLGQLSTLKEQYHEIFNNFLFGFKDTT